MHIVRKIVGYKLNDNMSDECLIKAIKIAIKNWVTNHNLLHHFDRGLKLCSNIYPKELKVNIIKTSMTDGYDYYQNALV